MENDNKFARFIDAIKSTKLGENDIKSTMHTSSVSVRDWEKVEETLKAKSKD